MRSLSLSASSQISTRTDLLTFVLSFAQLLSNHLPFSVELVFFARIESYMRNYTTEIYKLYLISSNSPDMAQLHAEIDNMVNQQMGVVLNHFHPFLLLPLLGKVE